MSVNGLGDLASRAGSAVVALEIALVIIVAFALLAGDHSSRGDQGILSVARGPIVLSNSRNGSAVLGATKMAPGQSVSGTVSISNKGGRSGALGLSPSNLDSPLGPGGGNLADALQLRIQDLSGGGGTLYEGPLASLPGIPLGGIRTQARRTYLFTALLPGDVGSAYSDTSAKVDLNWSAGSLKSQPPCAAEFTAGPGGQRLMGTIGGDLIKGGHGPDVIRGHAGEDCLHGEGGDDRNFGGHDDDTLYGEDGDDKLVGGSGTDALYGGPGDDRLVSDGARGDRVDCGPGFDVAYVDRFDRVVDCERVVRR